MLTIVRTSVILSVSLPRSQSLQIPLSDVLKPSADKDTADEQMVEISIESKVVLFTKHVHKK